MTEYIHTMNMGQGFIEVVETNDIGVLVPTMLNGYVDDAAVMNSEKFILFDDFFWYVSPHMWTSVDTGVTVRTIVAGTSQGALKMDTAGAENDLGVIASTNAIVGGQWAYQRLDMRVRVPQITNVKAQFGVSTDQSIPDAAATWSDYLEIASANGVPGNWYKVKNTNGVLVSTDTTVLSVQADYTDLSYVWSATGTTIACSIDGVSVGTLDAHGGKNMYIVMKVMAIGAAAAKTIYVDKVAFAGNRQNTVA
jgi:hypothetical protein